MKMNKDLPCPFSAYSKKYGQPASKWEKIFRTGYMWREYDTDELREYMQILTKYKPRRSVIEKFIRDAEYYENNSIHN